MKKGFTLVELLGVIIIIIAIGLVTVPVVSFILDDSKGKAYDAQVKIIIASADNYVLDNIDSINKPIDYVSIEELQKGGYLEKKDVINSETNEKENGCVVIKFSKDKFKYTYNKKTCTEINKDNVPTITVSESVIKIEVGSNLDLSTINSKVSATSHSGTSLEVGDPVITRNGKVVTSIDTSILGSKYILTYSVTDPSNELSAKNKIKVIINDTTSPIISVNGITDEQTISVKLNDRFSIPDAAVTDNSGENIECAISGSVNTEILGNYVITYKAVDSSGNEAEYKLNVNVIE